MDPHTWQCLQMEQLQALKPDTSMEVRVTFCFASQLAVLLNNLAAAKLGSAIQSSFNKLKSPSKCLNKYDTTPLLNKQKPISSGFAGEYIQDLSYNARVQRDSKYHRSLVI